MGSRPVCTECILSSSPEHSHCTDCYSNSGVQQQKDKDYNCTSYKTLGNPHLDDNQITSILFDGAPFSFLTLL